MRFLNICVLGILALTPPAAAGRDFLTTDEADQIRLAQEPNLRLATYAQFARQRVDLIHHLMEKGKAGRTSMIHETLEDYTKIIEAIDTVADDALIRGVDIGEGIAAVAKEEEAFLAELEKVQEGEPRDIARYRFALEIAIETTADSLEINIEDLGDRSQAVTAKQKQERREREALMTPEMAEDRQEQAKQTQKKEEKEKRKAPTLL
ncbi:MAG: hypothetical protein GY953_22585, partial [bacterium]|nr:hypothetical protein [bacterium]